MTPRQHLQVMRRWRSVIMAGLLIGLAVGWVSAPGKAATTTTFQATNTLLSQPPSGSGAQIHRAAVLATLGPVPSRVGARLGIDRRRVESMVVTYIPADEGALLITARSADRTLAEAVANVTAEELIVELGGSKAPLRALEPAMASPVANHAIRGPTSRPARSLMLAAFGLVLGIGAASAVDRFDNRIRSGRAAEEALGVPVVAEVPAIARSDRGRLHTGAAPSAFIEAYRGLGTSVDRMTPGPDGDDGHRIILVTSAGSGEGKTTTVAHLAVTLAGIGHSVLVVSADLRHPRLHLYFDRPRHPGLADVLRGAPDARGLADLDLTTDIPGIRFVPSGTPVDNPGPLLDRVGDFLRDARTLGDFTLVDSPPLLTSSDAAALARHADGTLLVVRAGRTSIGAATSSAELLRRLGLPVLGAVLVAGDTAASVRSKDHIPSFRTDLRTPHR